MAIRISSRAVIVNDGKILLNVMGDGIYSGIFEPKYIECSQYNSEI